MFGFDREKGMGNMWEQLVQNDNKYVFMHVYSIHKIHI